MNCPNCNSEMYPDKDTLQCPNENCRNYLKLEKNMNIPEYTADQVAKAKAKAEDIRRLVDLAGASGAYGSEGALLVLDGYARQLERELAHALKDKARLDWLDRDDNKAREAKSYMAFHPEDPSRAVIDSICKETNP